MEMAKLSLNCKCSFEDLVAVGDNVPRLNQYDMRPLRWMMQVRYVKNVHLCLQQMTRLIFFRTSVCLVFYMTSSLILK
jgi:hypothetical protein